MAGQQLTQGEVWQIDFAPSLDRPGIIVSRDQLNRGSMVLVVPTTGTRVEERSRYGNNVFLKEGVGGLSEDSVAQSHLIQPVNVEDLMWRRGKLTLDELSPVLLALAWTIDLFDSVNL